MVMVRDRLTNQPFKITVKKVKYGKKVTVIELNGGEVDDMKLLVRELKRRLGAGGYVRDGAIEIQGDHRKRIKLIESIIEKHLRRP